MGGNKEMNPSLEQTSGYEPEWAREFDVDEPSQRSDSESFDRAIEMGVEAAEELEREKLLASSSSSESKKSQTNAKQNKGHRAKEQQNRGASHPKKQNKGSQTKKSQREKEDTSGTLGAVLYVLLGIGAIVAFVFLLSWVDSLKNDNSSYSTQKQRSTSAVKDSSLIQPEKQDDGSFHAYVDLSNPLETKLKKKVALPAEVGKGHKKWAMRVHATIDTSSKYVASCEPSLHYNAYFGPETMHYLDWCKKAENASNGKMMQWTSVVGVEEPVDPSVFRTSTVDALYILPPFTERRGIWNPHDSAVNPNVTFTGGSVKIDVDFVPISNIAIEWDRTEPIKGTESTFIAFSGSLDELKLQYEPKFAYADTVKLYTYDPRFFSTWNGDGLLDLSWKTNVVHSETIERYGLPHEDASVYLFVEKQVDSVQWQLE